MWYAHLVYEFATRPAFGNSKNMDQQEVTASPMTMIFSLGVKVVQKGNS
jgi:hypothetical protein